MTANIRKRLISKRGDNCEISDEELIIHLSDTDSISYYTTSDEEQLEPIKKEPNYLDKNRLTREISPIPNWADEVTELRHQPQPQERQKKKDKRFSNGKRQEDHPMTSRWTHDMYVSDEDDKPKKQKQKKPTKKTPQKASDPRPRKQHSYADHAKNEQKQDHKEKLTKSIQNHMDEDDTLAEPVRQRRGFSQASKNQLIAAFTRNPPLRPSVVLDRKPRSPSPNNEKPPANQSYPQPAQQLQNVSSSSPKSQLHKALSDLSLNPKRTKYKKEDRIPTLERQERSETVSSSPSHRSSRSNRSNVSIEPSPLIDQVVQTSSGSWAILDGKEKLKPVQPVITPSGHMVLITESGLMIPATQDMFQHQVWVSQTQQHRVDQNQLDPDYCFKQFKNEQGQQQALP